MEKKNIIIMRWKRIIFEDKVWKVPVFFGALKDHNEKRLTTLVVSERRDLKW